MNEEILAQLERLNNLKTSGGITEAEFEQYKTALLRGTTTPPTTPAPNPVLATQAPPTKMTTAQKWVIGFVIFLGFVALSRIYDENKPTEAHTALERAKEEARRDSIEFADMGISTPVATTKPDSLKSDWQISDVDDEMDGMGHYAQITATNGLVFDFPYQGGSIVSLTIRRVKGETNAFLSVSKGQFVSDYSNPMVRIKIDNKPTASYSTSAASDGSPDVLFINSAQRLIGALRGSKRATIEAQFYQEGNHKMEFNTKGFVWK